MYGPLPPLSCVPCSWDPDFRTLRESFHTASENITEEYLREYNNTRPRNQHHGPAKGKHDYVTETAKTVRATAAGSGNGPTSIHQAEVIADFCRQLQCDLPTSGDGEEVQERHVAQIYEWENKPSQPARQREAYPPLLTHESLLAKLCQKRFVDKASLPDEMDADLRLIFINNLDPLIISILARTTSRLETPVLQRTIFRHLTARSSFEVHTSTRGFKTFSLEFNISYFSLRKDTEKLHKFDTRRRRDGSEPLRETLFSPKHPTEDDSSTGHSAFNIYETQISIALTGVDHYRWTAWGIVDDTWFEPGDTLSEYNEGPESGSKPDPLSAGELDADPPERDPRLYFLKIFEIRIGIIAREWDYILYVLQKEVHCVSLNPLFDFPERSFENRSGRDEIRKLATWNNDMIKLVGTLIKSLSQTLVAWEVFQKTDIGYFLDVQTDNKDLCQPSEQHAYTCVSSSSSTIGGGEECYNQRSSLPGQQRRGKSLLPSLRVIEKTFLSLHIIHEEMEQLKMNLEDLGRALVRGEKNYSTFVQQRTGEHVKLLTWVTIGWSPVMIATGMCSAQDGIFPFQNNIWDFFASLLVVSGLVGLTIIILLLRQGSSLIDWSILSSSRSSAASPDKSPDHDPDDGAIEGAACLRGGRRRTMPFAASAPETFTRSSRRWTADSGTSSLLGKSTFVSKGWELGGLGSRSPTVRPIPRTHHPAGRGYGAHEPYMIV